jgi:FkbM family methyltransferase
MQTKEFQFRGNPYRVACLETYPQHPSWYTFEDESATRDAMWKPAVGDYVMDVGAAFGSYTMTALSQGAQFVWAWSPQGVPNEETELQMLQRSLDLNGWSDRCKIYDHGFYDRNGWLNTETQILTDERPPEADFKTIKVQTLDSWYDEVQPSRIDWMKMDVEGAEVEVILGAPRLITERRPKIFVENHLFRDSAMEQKVKAALQELGPYREVLTLPHHSVSHTLYQCDS